MLAHQIFVSIKNLYEPTTFLLTCSVIDQLWSLSPSTPETRRCAQVDHIRLKSIRDLESGSLDDINCRNFPLLSPKLTVYNEAIAIEGEWEPIKTNFTGSVDSNAVRFVRAHDPFVDDGQTTDFGKQV